MNTALLLHLLGLAQHVIHGHHFRTTVVPECFETVKVAGTHPVMYRFVCGLIKYGPHFISVTWR
jgi:hypothetical protein